MEPGLYVVGTPIGNLADLTLRAINVLGEADAVLAEDTRRTRKLMSRHDLHTPLVSCHRFSEASRVAAVIERIRGGEAMALVTDSGMPGVSDPGARVVDACLREGIAVRVVPGPSAVTAAVALCGFPTEGFVFEGFLPVKAGSRGRRLQALAGESRAVVLFESPHRLRKLLGELEACVPGRWLFLGRELTKHFEEVIRGTPGDVQAALGERTVKGEVVMVLGPAKQGQGTIDTTGARC